MVEAINNRIQEALIRSIIWAFIGSLYGMLFIFFFTLAEYLELPLSPILIAGTLAGTIAALIYSSMRLAVIVAAVSSFVSLFYVVLSDNHLNLTYMTLATAIVGGITGALYGMMAKTSRVYRADAKTLTGVVSGALVSVFAVLLKLIFPSLPLGFIVAFSCLLTGSLYVTIVPAFIKRFDGLLPPMADGAMVGTGSSIFVALLFFVMITGITPEAAGTLHQFSAQIRDIFPQASLGGLLGGGISGFISGMTLRRWQDL
jgi:hypothetical protein